MANLCRPIFGAELLAKGPIPRREEEANPESIMTTDAKSNPLPERMPQLVCAVLLGLIAWTAWDYGGGYVSTKFAGAAGMSLLLVGTAFWLLTRQGRLPGLPAVAFVACLVWCGGYLQTVDLPVPLARWLSPASASAHTEWVPDAIRSEAANAGSIDHGRQSVPISVAPELTRMALALPASFAIAACLSSVCFPVGRIAVVFLGTISVVGGFFAFFGLADAVLLTQASTMELWDRLLITPGGTRSAFGPFVNNNNAGGFLNLAIACAVGLTVYAMRQKSIGRSALLFVCLFTLAVLIAGVLGSKSRGAFLGMVAGTLCLSIVVLRSGIKSRIVWVLSGLSCVACTLLMGIGLLSRFQGRIRTLWTGDALEDPRLAHWQDSLSAAASYFPAGAGLGSYRYAYLPYQSESGSSWFLHADGMPFEWLLEGGLWLLPLILVAMGFVIRDLFRIARQTEDIPANHRRASEAFFLAMLFALPSIVVSQCFDYGILQPSLLLTFACLCGGVAGFATRVQKIPATDETQRAPKPAFIPSVRWAIGGAAMACLCFAMIMSTADLYVGAVVERVERDRIALMRIPITERPSRQDEIAQISMLARFRDRDASVQILLARLMIDEQQRRGATFLVDESLVAAGQVAKLVSPRTLRKTHYACIDRRGREPDTDSSASGCATIEDLMLPGQDLESWREARTRAALALVCRPLDDSARILLVELDMLSDSTPQLSPQLVEQVKRLRPRNSNVQNLLSRL